MVYVMAGGFMGQGAFYDMTPLPLILFFVKKKNKGNFQGGHEILKGNGTNFQLVIRKLTLNRLVDQQGVIIASLILLKLKLPELNRWEADSTQLTLWQIERVRVILRDAFVIVWVR